jgi:hypothetical protein
VARATTLFVTGNSDIVPGPGADVVKGATVVANVDEGNSCPSFHNNGSQQHVFTLAAGTSVSDFLDADSGEGSHTDWTYTMTNDVKP